MIDTSFNFHTDAGGRDPDSHSPTLRRYHQRLWSKKLPGGALFDLRDSHPHAYLHHHSALGEFFLASDTVVPTLSNRGALHDVIRQVPQEDIDEFLDLIYTIGGMMVFPGNRIAGKQTLNGARGFHPRIADRMDLTLECIRRYYAGQPSPLGAVLERHRDFFDLFEHFGGYVEYFLLQDLMAPGGRAVHFFTEFEDFTTSALPSDLAAYRHYRSSSMEFVHARNARIAAWDRQA